jgi:exopolysaccharide biosynthesis polyprenyl glycosylphosphotransferase
MASATELIEILRRERWTGFRVVGVCLPHGVHALAVQGIPVIGTPATVRRAVEEAGADTVFVASGLGATGQDTRRLTWRLEGTGTQIAVLPSLTDVSGPRIRVKPIAGLPLLYLELPEFSGTQRTIKRLLDLAVAGIALVLATPVLLLIAAGIRLGSPGPVLFRQTRVGRGGELFTCLKFRTMVQEAESQLAALQEDHDGNGLLFKLRHDPRVTRLGRPLRRYSLDELPQLVNVLKGDMSLVGPRPPLPSEVARYPDDLRRRLLVRPGLTGLWQVSGRSDLSAADSSRLDLYYVDNWSVMYDAQIVWKTLGAVVAGRGAF